MSGPFSADEEQIRFEVVPHRFDSTNDMLLAVQMCGYRVLDRTEIMRTWLPSDLVLFQKTLRQNQLALLHMRHSPLARKLRSKYVLTYRSQLDGLGAVFARRVPRVVLLHDFGRTLADYHPPGSGLRMAT